MDRGHSEGPRTTMVGCLVSVVTGRECDHLCAGQETMSALDLPTPKNTQKAVAGDLLLRECDWQASAGHNLEVLVLLQLMPAEMAFANYCCPQMLSCYQCRRLGDDTAAAEARVLQVCLYRWCYLRKHAWSSERSHLRLISPQTGAVADR